MSAKRPLIVAEERRAALEARLTAYERVAEAARKMDHSSPTLNTRAYRAARREFHAALSALQASEDRTIGDTKSERPSYLDTEGD